MVMWICTAAPWGAPPSGLVGVVPQLIDFISGANAAGRPKLGCEPLPCAAALRTASGGASGALQAQGSATHTSWLLSLLSITHPGPVTRIHGANGEARRPWTRRRRC